MAFLTKIGQAIQGALASVVLTVATVWDKLPVGVQKVIRDVVVAVVGNVMALNLVLPHDLSQATAETMLVVTTVVFTAYGVIRRELWPIIIEWIIAKLGLNFDWNESTDRECLTR
jgi:hypothetical protein